MLSATSRHAQKLAISSSSPPPQRPPPGTLRGRVQMHEEDEEGGATRRAAFGSACCVWGHRRHLQTSHHRAYWLTPTRAASVLRPCCRGLIYPSQLMGLARFGAVAGGVVLWATHPYGKLAVAYCDLSLLSCAYRGWETERKAPM